MDSRIRLVIYTRLLHALSVISIVARYLDHGPSASHKLPLCVESPSNPAGSRSAQCYAPLYPTPEWRLARGSLNPLDIARRSSTSAVNLVLCFSIRCCSPGGG